MCLISLQVSGSLTELGMSLSVAHQDRGWWAGVVACQVRGWWPVSWPARAWAGRSVSVARQGWAGGLVCRLARTEAGGRRIGPPGQGLVGRCRPCSRSGLESSNGASCLAHWAYASGVPEACFWACQGAGICRDGRRWSALATTLKFLLKLPTATVLRRPPVGLGLTCSKIYRLFYSALLLNLSYYCPLSSNYSH